MAALSVVSRIVRSGVLLCLLAVLSVASAAGSVRWLGERRFTVTPETDTLGAVALPLESSWQAGERAVPLVRGEVALQARIDLIELAQHSIDVQYYTLDDGEVGRALLCALGEAADRGVEVRVLLDDIGLVGREAMLSRFAAEHESLSLRVFNPTWLRSARAFEYLARFPRATRRMHNKSLTVDGAASVVGGRNIGDGYFGKDESLNFADLDVLATGEVSAETRRAFDSYWRSGLAFDIVRLRGADASVADEDYREWAADARAALERRRAAAGQEGEGIVSALRDGRTSGIAATVRTVSDPPTKVIDALDDVGGTVAPEVLRLLAGAREEVLIVSPYLIPGEAGMEVIRTLVEQGVSVTILTNSYAANDVAAVHLGYRDYRGPLLELGVSLHEFKPAANAASWRYRDSLGGRSKTTLHAKAFVIDRRIGFVGSFNLDPRSSMHNTEMGVVVEGAEFAAMLHEHLGRSLEERAWEVALTPSGTLQWRDRAGGAERVVDDADPGTVLPQRMLLYLASWLPVDWML